MSTLVVVESPAKAKTIEKYLGKGYTVKSAMLEMSMVAEGYYATKSAKKIKEENGAVTPIIDAVYSVLYKGRDAKRVFEELTKQID